MATEFNGKEDGFVVRVWQCVMEKGAKVAKSVKKIGGDDPRRIVHSFKVALALTIVSLLYYFNPLYDSFGIAGMWAITTVIFVFEYTVGATLSKGLIRALATMLAGSLALGVHYVSNLCGQGEPIFLGVSVFLLGVATTFSRFFPLIKARYDYGVFVFFLTFSLVAVSGYRNDELLEMAHRRLSSVSVGGLACIFISIFICPVWAGADLHEVAANNFDKLASFLEGFGAEFFKGNEEEEKKAIPQGYKSVLNSKTGEESLANFAIWEPGHGRFRFKYPWRQYLKIGSLARQCAYSIEALNACVISYKAEGSVEFRRHIEGPCTKMSLASGKALKELSVAVKGMIAPVSAAPYVKSAKTATSELNSTLETALLEESSVLEILRMATIASLLVEIVGHVEELAEAVEELAVKAEFKNAARVEGTVLAHRSTIAPLSDDVSDEHVVVDIVVQNVPSDNMSDSDKEDRTSNQHVAK